MSATRRKLGTCFIACLGFWAAGAEVAEQILKAFPSEAGDRPKTLIQGFDGALYGVLQNGGCSNHGAVFSINTNALGFTLLHTFARFNGDGQNPTVGLVQGRDGALYGTTGAGGENGAGTVFKVDTNGNNYAVLYSFQTGSGDGQSPFCGVVQGRDGALYGTCYSGGLWGSGTVFKLNTNGADYALLHHFNPGTGDGKYPEAALVQGVDGALYGTTFWDGGSGKGIAFKVNSDGSDYTIIHDFSSITNDGANPVAALVQGIDSALYGTCEQGGTNSRGTVFKINTNGTGYAVLHNFSATGGDGQSPYAALMQGTNGQLYGTTTLGGNGKGTIFRIGTNGTGYIRLHSFGIGTDAEYPYYPALVQGRDGVIYGASAGGGTTVATDPVGLGTLYKLNPDGSGYLTFYNFTAAEGDGQQPYAGVLQASDGALYGTTKNGGAGYGTVFTVKTDGAAYSVLRSFASSDGYNPSGDLLLVNENVLYGTTYDGGGFGSGTIFKLNCDGTGFSVVHRFNINGGDGGNPQAGLLQGNDGLLYGTTYIGGISNRGTVFSLRTDGSNYSVLHNFGVTTNDGIGPRCLLLQATNGVLYGTTEQGGTGHYGTVFKLNTDGSEYSVLRNFTQNSGDAGSPEAGLIQGIDGALYGTTAGGGSRGSGTVFKLNLDGTNYTELVSFVDPTGDGRNPYSAIIQGSDTALYGTTYFGDSNRFGSIFKLNTDGSGYTELRNFDDSATGGQNPVAKLTQGKDGALYGTTPFGSDLGSGAVFRLAGSLIPPLAITNQPSSRTNVVGSSASFLVGASSTLPVAYIWQKDGNFLSNGGTVSGATKARLTLGPLSQSDAGVYTVVITNAFGAVTSSQAILIVVEPPVFTGVRRLSNGTIQLFLNCDSNLLCRVQASTNLTEWETLADIHDTNGIVQFIDLAVTNLQQRFYRAALVP